MKIRDLSAPVTASKSDWLAGTSWIGFTPTDESLTARNRCQSTIQREFGTGYIIEYITQKSSPRNRVLSTLRAIWHDLKVHHLAHPTWRLLIAHPRRRNHLEHRAKGRS